MAPSEDDAALTVPDLIRAQAHRSPDAVAVESAAEQLTYAQLVGQASALAHRLFEAGVRPGEPVAVAMPRGVDLVAALLGVQLAGAAYVPLDPEHPADRLNFILRDAGARVLLTADTAGVPGLRAATHIHLDEVAAQQGTAPLAPLHPDTAAYVIYTSGSTGQPKGVLVTHRALANFIASMREHPGLPDNVVLPAVTTASFDIAGLELFLPLTTGGRVVVASQAEAADPHRLAAVLARTDARVMQATPVTWRLLLETGWTPPAGFTVLCGGERLPAELADRLLGDQVVLWDLYGPTETTIWSAVTRYERGCPTWFGPVRDTSLHLLDDRLRPTVDNESGELYIGGAGLATGYLGRAALTAQRFVADPYAGSPGARLYRTGDVARRHPDGRIEILGRSDDQIKIRGFRIEPGEIEHLLAGHPQVAEAAVRAVGTGQETARLVGWIRPTDPANPPGSRDLQLHLGRTLPAYMIPTQFVVLDAFPRTHNGKLERTALPVPPKQDAPAPAAFATDGELAGRTGQRVAEVLAGVLELPEIGPHEDFFTLGGDSLRAVQAILTLNAELKREIPINALFEARTAYGLALVLEGDGEPEPELTPLPADRAPRLSSGQWRTWLHQQRLPDYTGDNQPLAVLLPGPLDLAALESALTGLQDRHELLRTRYEYDSSGQPVPVVLPSTPVRLVVEDADPQTVLAAELARPFDLSEEPPVRMRLVRSADGSALLLMVLHHIAADSRSRAVIARQLRAAYRGRDVPAPALRYPDYAEWQRKLVASPVGKRHLDFWRTALTGLDLARLRTDRPRPLSRNWQGDTVRFEVPAAAAEKLRELAFANDTTASVALLAVYYATLARYTEGTDLTVGVQVPGLRPELADMVGLFEEIAVIRVDLGGGLDFQQLLRQVRDAALAAHRHAVMPLEEVIAAVLDVVETKPAPGRNPLFDATFEVQGVPAHQVGFRLPNARGVKSDLSLHLVDRADSGIDGRIDYATQLFDETTMARLAGDFTSLLVAVGAAPAHRLENEPLLDRA
ncbi:amino acid adenylation domain-containing protein [Streptomyces sp. NPDC005125]